MPSIQSNLKIHRRITIISLLMALFALCSLVGIIAGIYLRSSHKDSSATDAESPVDLSVDIPSVISLTTNATNGTLSIPIVPTPVGAFASRDLTVSVETNNPAGYKLIMNSETNDTALTNHTASGSIPSISSAGVLAANTWGYLRWHDGESLNITSSTSMSPIPAMESPVTLRDAAGIAAPQDTTVSFAVNVDTSISSGAYINNMVFTATSDYVPTAPLTMQTFTAEQCTALPDNGEPITVVDARNNQLYYVKKISGSGSDPVTGNLIDLCWMVSNLRYEGGGNDRYGDALELSPRSSGQATYTTAEYMNPGGSTDYTDTSPGDGEYPSSEPSSWGFYGYLYNWCAAMGGQTNACEEASHVQSEYDKTISICPAGWRLPGGGFSATAVGNDFGALNDAINSGSDSSDSILLSDWFGMYSGIYRDEGFNSLGSTGFYWSASDVFDTNYFAARNLLFSSDTSNSGVWSQMKNYGLAVRCVKETTSLPLPDPSTTLGALQKLTISDCPTTRATAFDARDKKVYWVQKIANSGFDPASGNRIDLCWMETNLAYAGYNGTDEQWDSSWGWPDDRYATSASNDTANIYDDMRPLTMILEKPFEDSDENPNTAFSTARVAGAGGARSVDSQYQYHSQYQYQSTVPVRHRSHHSYAFAYGRITRMPSHFPTSHWLHSGLLLRVPVCFRRTSPCRGRYCPARKRRPFVKRR